MSESEHEHYAEWDAAYVLGALTLGERSAYEAHLQACAHCREAVGELAQMPGLLAQVRAVAMVPEQPMPEGVLDGVLDREAARHRRSRRNRIWTLAASLVLFAAIAVPALIIATSGSDARTVALTPVSSTAMTTNVRLDPVPWGTRLTVSCDYPEGEEWGGENGPWSYALWVTDSNGEPSQVSTWNAVAGKSVSLDAATAIEIDDIQSVSVVRANGDVMLSSPVG